MATGWTKEEEELIVRIYPDTKRSELVKIFNRRADTIDKFARRRGLVKSKQTKLCCNRKGDLTPLLNDSLETYYWVGFVLADGCFQRTNQLMVTLAVNDVDHLEEFAKYLKTTIRHVYSDTQVVLAVQDRIIVPQVMTKYGIPYNKTYSCVNFPFKLTREQAYSIFIGFIDGDGSRNRYGIKIQNYETWHPFYKLMEEYIGNINVRYLHYRDKKTVICNLKKSQINILIDFIKDNNLPAMKRKWYKFE